MSRKPQSGGLCRRPAGLATLRLAYLGREPRQQWPPTVGGCVNCGRRWTVRTHAVVWYFEGGKEGFACPDCGSADERTSRWQLFCDIADAIDVLMQRGKDLHEKKFMAAVISSRAHWFSLWREDHVPDPDQQG